MLRDQLDCRARLSTRADWRHFVDSYDQTGRSQNTSYLRCLILQLGFQLLHHKLTNGAKFGYTDTDHILQRKEGRVQTCM